MQQIKYIFAAFLLFGTVGVQAQKGTGFFGVNGGVSLPLGNWGKTTYDDSKSGFAATGFVTDIDGAYFFSKHLGVGGLLRYASYKTKDINGLSAGYQDAFDVDQVVTSAGGYHAYSVLPGLYYAAWFSRKFVFTGRALAGITITSTPHISVDVQDGDDGMGGLIDDGTFEQKSATKAAFAFDIGIGAGYALSSSWLINLHGDYFYSKPDFQIENVNRQNNAGRLVDAYSEPLAGIQVSLGVAYRLGKRS